MTLLWRSRRFSAQIRDILARLPLAIEYVMAFVLLAGFTVLFAALAVDPGQSPLYEGQRLLRTLGAPKQLLRQAKSHGICIAGRPLAGVMAIVAAELITLLLYRFGPQRWFIGNPYLLVADYPLTGWRLPDCLRRAHWVPARCGVKAPIAPDQQGS